MRGTDVTARKGSGNSRERTEHAPFPEAWRKGDSGSIDPPHASKKRYDHPGKNGGWHRDDASHLPDKRGTNRDERRRKPLPDRTHPAKRHTGHRDKRCQKREADVPIHCSQTVGCLVLAEHAGSAHRPENLRPLHLLAESAR